MNKSLRSVALFVLFSAASSTAMPAEQTGTNPHPQITQRSIVVAAIIATLGRSIGL